MPTDDFYKAGTLNSNAREQKVDIMFLEEEKFKTASTQLREILTKVLSVGELTDEDIADISNLKVDIDESYNNIKDANVDLTYFYDELNRIKANMVGANADEILDILTEGGTKCWLYKDDNDNVLIDFSSIPELTAVVNKLNIIAQEDGKTGKITLTPDFIQMVVGEVGSNSESIKDITAWYYLSTSPTTQVGGEWVNKLPDMSQQQGKFLWYKLVTTKGDGTVEEGEPIRLTGQDGKDGTSVNILGTYGSLEELQQAHPNGNKKGDGYIVNGDLHVWNGEKFVNVGKIQGDNGQDGKTAYIHIKYSNDGGETFTGNNGEDVGLFMGVYSDHTLEDSNNPKKYKWALIKGKDGMNGAAGVDGNDGTSIIWKGSFDNHPTHPEDGWAYYNTSDRKSYVYQSGTWYQMTIDGTDGQNGNNGKDGLSIEFKGEMKNPPAYPKKNWCYKDTDNGIVYIYTGTSWEVLTYDGNNGTDGAPGNDGKDGLSVFCTYHDSTIKPSTPTGNGTTRGWHTNWTSNIVWISQKVAKSDVSGTWGEPIKIQGQDGTGVESLTIEYAANKSTTQPPVSGWSTTMPQYQKELVLWIRTKVIYTNSPTPVYSKPFPDPSWKGIVQDGGSGSSITITPQMIEAIAKSKIKFKAENISLEGYTTVNDTFKIMTDGSVEAKSLAVEDEISTDILTVNKIANEKYPESMTADTAVWLDSTAYESSSEFVNDGIYKSLDNLKEVCPRNLNGFTLTINLKKTYQGNITLDTFYNGSIRFCFKRMTLKGYLYCYGPSCRFYIYGNDNVSTGSSNMASIMPGRGRESAGYYYAIHIDSTKASIYDLNVYKGSDSYVNHSGICYNPFSNGYIKNIKFYNSPIHGLRTHSTSNVYVDSSNGDCERHAFHALSGSIITLKKTGQAGSSSGNHTKADDNSQIFSTGATFNSTSNSGGNNTPSGGGESRTATITPSYGDTYRKTVYNNWKKDGTVRQGSWGYGNCVGAWFFGDKLKAYRNMSISRIEIKVTRSAGGLSSSVVLKLKTHKHGSKPGGAPTFYTSLGTINVGTNASNTLTITNPSQINAIINDGGIGLDPGTYSNSNYAVCSGACSVKITYTDNGNTYMIDPT